MKNENLQALAMELNLTNLQIEDKYLRAWLENEGINVKGKGK